MVAFYFNVFVLGAQLFQKGPVLHALAPTQSEPPFLITQKILLTLFVVLSIAASMKFCQDSPGQPVTLTNTVATP